MKKIFLSTILIALLVFTAIGCSEGKGATTPKISAQELTLKIGESYTLTIENKADLSFQWESSDQKIVRVLYGAVTALSEGEAEVYAVSSDLKLTCKIEVVKGEEESKENNSSQDNSLQNKDQGKKSGTSSNSSEKSNAEKTKETVNNLIESIIDNKYNKKADELKKEYDTAVAEIDEGITAAEKLINSDTLSDTEKQYWKNQKDALITDKQRLKDAYDSALAEINKQREEEKASPNGLIQ
ncbi:MAG: Ig-like domain-containing protein [Acutalibacteraceae bacterium]|nr:Ig-like domain-containing protein [Acutalibacteraceae bacterium]